MKAVIKIIAGQGKPLHPLPHRSAPENVSPLSGGDIFSGRTMAQTVSVSKGMETYGEKHAPKWQEANPIAARSEGHTFSGVAAPRHTIPQTTFFASDMHHKWEEGAARLHQLLDWLVFCTLPWTKHGQPPMLYVAVGRRSFYGYLDGFDPTIEEFMPDDNAGKVTGLPYKATFGLSFIAEPLGPRALQERIGGLPRDMGLKGGAGGFLDPAVTDSTSAVTPTSGTGGGFGSKVGSSIYAPYSVTGPIGGTSGGSSQPSGDQPRVVKK